MKKMKKKLKGLGSKLRGAKAKVSQAISNRRVTKLAKKGKVTAGFGKTKGSKVNPKMYDKGGTKQRKEMKATGKVSKGAVGAEVTKGGTYVKYKKDSKAAGSFRSTFKSKCVKGAKGFTWQGRKYNCNK